MDQDYFKTVFYEECADLLQSAEENLTILSADPSNLESLHAVFRSVHSIKGGAGSFGLKQVVEFTHVFETVMDLLRSSQLTLDESLKHLLFSAFDILADLVRAAEQGSVLDDSFGAHEKNELEKITNSVAGSVSSDQRKDDTSLSKKTDHDSDQFWRYKISFVPHPNLMHYGNDPLLVLKELREKCAQSYSFKVSVDQSMVPDLSEINPCDFYLAWKIEFLSNCDEQAIHEIFDFVADLSSITLEKEHAKESSLGANKQTIVAKNSESKDSNQKDDQKASVKNDIVHSLRIEIDRIDRLVNTVGEIVIKQSIVADQANKLDGSLHAGLLRGIHELSQYTRELQENVMAIRAQPIKTVFSRIPRIVRDLANELKKEVVVETLGENTDIDKTVIENLSEPLTHMVRNAVDHGIESPEERIAANKPREGKLIISAEHKSGQILIQIRDDGKGINRERVLKKAIEKGLVQPNANLSGDEIDNLIFLPGFSTAENVTNISGRGVGMDVVKRSIQGLGGRIHLQSVEGKGCNVVLSLPLTLAVLDGMVISCGSEIYIIPLVNILEIIRPSPNQITHLVGRTSILNLRKSTIPLVSLTQTFNITDGILDPSKGTVVIVETERGIAGLVVSELLGQQQVVIKSLEANHEHVPGISAATIMGNGNVVPILDISAICSLRKTAF